MTKKTLYIIIIICKIIYSPNIVFFFQTLAQYSNTYRLHVTQNKLLSQYYDILIPLFFYVYIIKK